MERNNTYEYSYTIKDIECEINNFFTKTVPGMNSFTGEFFQTFEERITQCYVNSSRKQNKI